MTLSLLRRIPTKAAKILRFTLRLPALWTRGLRFYPPNYIYAKHLNSESIVVDVGCGHVAEFSKHVMEKYGAKAVGVDPTKKHAPFLEKLADETGGRFAHLPAAVAATSGKLVFNESVDNESGSLLDDHNNVLNDRIRTYEVEVITFGQIPGRIGVKQVDLVKIDLEGIEYDVIPALTAEDCRPFSQIFCEFHHHCIDRYTPRDTQKMVAHMTSLGLTAFSLDDHNYLFYRE